MSQSPSKDFSYLKDWLAHPDPVPVVLECIPSRTGMSMGVYDREERIYSVPGAAFGGGLRKALDTFLERCFTLELAAMHPTWPDWAKARGYDLYGRGPKLGSDSIETSIRMAEALGLSVRNTSSKSGTLLIITRRESKS